MYIVDNSVGSNYEGAVLSTYKKIMEWSMKPPASSAAKKWIEIQKTIRENSDFFL